MKVRLLGLLVLPCILGIVCIKSQQQTFSQAKTPSLATPSQAEQDLLNEINQARAHPHVYAGYLEKLKPLFKGKQYAPTGHEAFETQEGWSAVEDAIKFLRSAKPLPPLSMSQGLYLAASMHVKDQSSSGATGHKGSDSTFIEQRVKSFGDWQGGIGENLAYGNESARERILTWLIDDGFASRGHRNRLMSENYKVAGVSCGSHPEYGAMCVVTLAGGFSENLAAKTASTNSNTSKPAQTPTNNNKRTSRKPGN